MKRKYKRLLLYHRSDRSPYQAHTDPTGQCLLVATTNAYTLEAKQATFETFQQ